MDLLQGVKGFFEQPGGEKAEVQAQAGGEDAGGIADAEGSCLELAGVGEGGVVVKDFVCFAECVVVGV